MEALKELKNAIVASAASTGVASMETLHELLAEFFRSEDGKKIVDEAIENYMSSAKGIAAIESAIVAAIARRRGETVKTASTRALAGNSSPLRH